MEMNTPAWLQQESHTVPAPAVAAPGITSVPPPAPPAAGAPPMAAAAEEDDDPDLPGIILTMRLANMGVAAALIVISVRVVFSMECITVATV
jgi:hypothetical protein